MNAFPVKMLLGVIAALVLAMLGGLLFATLLIWWAEGVLWWREL